MEEKNDPQVEVDEDILNEADRLAAEVEAEIAQMGNIGALGELEGLDQIPPELLENLTPEQILELIAAQAQQRKKPRSYYTRNRGGTKAQRKKKRDAQKRARAITRKKGWGRTISKRKRKKAA